MAQERLSERVVANKGFLIMYAESKGIPKEVEPAVTGYKKQGLVSTLSFGDRGGGLAKTSIAVKAVMETNNKKIPATIFVLGLSEAEEGAKIKVEEFLKWAENSFHARGESKCHNVSPAQLLATMADTESMEKVWKKGALKKVKLTAAEKALVSTLEKTPTAEGEEEDRDEELEVARAVEESLAPVNPTANPAANSAINQAFLQEMLNLLKANGGTAAPAVPAVTIKYIFPDIDHLEAMIQNASTKTRVVMMDQCTREFDNSVLHYLLSALREKGVQVLDLIQSGLKLDLTKEGDTIYLYVDVNNIPATIRADPSLLPQTAAIITTKGASDNMKELNSIINRTKAAATNSAQSASTGTVLATPGTISAIKKAQIHIMANRDLNIWYHVPRLLG